MQIPPPDALLTKAFSGSKLNNARIIVNEFLAQGMPLSLALAAVVNAVKESSLIADIEGDGGRSIGLFQIHDLNGKRTFTGDRRDPVYNTRWIIEETRREGPRRKVTKGGPSGQVFQGSETLYQAMARGASVAELAGLFGAYIERPDRVVSEYHARKALASALFPGVALVPGHVVDGAGSVIGTVTNFLPASPGAPKLPTKSPGDSGGSWIWWLAPTVAVGVGLLLVVSAFRR